MGPLAGCSSSKGDGAAGQAGASAGTSGAGGGSGAGARGGQGGGGAGGGAVGSGDFRVTLEASRTTLCPGQCAELSAHAQDGRAPFSYSWSPEIGEGEGPHEVCPEADTTYTVTARDVGVDDDEFGMASEEASAAIEVRVRERCDEVMDGGMTVPPEEPRSLCDVRLSYGVNAWVSSVTGWEGGSNLTTDDEASLFVVGGFGGTIEIAGKSLSSKGMLDTFVLKLNDACEVLWIAQLGEASAQIGLGTVGVGPSGDPVIGGSLVGSATLGDATHVVGDNGAALLVKLDGDDGQLLWSNVYPSFFYSSGIWDIGVDDEDAIVLSGYAAADVSFGGAPIGGPSGNVTFLAKLTSSGGHVFSQAITTTDLWLPIAVHPSGDIAAAGWGAEGTEIAIGGGTVFISGPAWMRYAVLLDASGALVWSTTFGEDDDREIHGWWGGGLAIDGNRNVVVEHGGYDQTVDGVLYSEPVTISRLSAMGEVLWTEVTGDLGVDDFYAHGGISTDSLENIVHVNEIREGDGGVGLPDAGPSRTDVVVRKLGPDGAAIWDRRIGSAYYEYSWGVAVDRDDSIWVAHIEEQDIQSGDGSLVITKLAP